LERRYVLCMFYSELISQMHKWTMHSLAYCTFVCRNNYVIILRLLFKCIVTLSFEPKLVLYCSLFHQVNLRCSHRSPSYSMGQWQVSGAIQFPPFMQGSLHTAVDLKMCMVSDNTCVNLLYYNFVRFSQR